MPETKTRSGLSFIINSVSLFKKDSLEMLYSLPSQVDNIIITEDGTLKHS